MYVVIHYHTLEQRRLTLNQCIYHGLCNPFLWGATRYVVTIASLEVGYIYLSCCHLHSFASYDRPYAPKTKYPVARDYQFLVDVVFACSFMKGFARSRYHFYTSIV